MFFNPISQVLIKKDTFDIALIMRILFIILFCTSFLVGNQLKAQSKFKHKGFSSYKKYDNSFITPDLRGKHSVSLGGVVNSFGSNLAEVVPNFGAHLGYNYLVLSRRKLKFTSKDKYRNEVKYGVGVHFTFLTENEFIIMGTFYRPLFGAKTRLLSFKFLSEYGLGVYKTANLLNETRAVKFNLSIELFRLKIGKGPFHLLSTFNYDIANDFLDKERLNVGITAGIRYYFYKNKP